MKFVRPQLSRNRAFTLIELLVVILVIGILVAVALPSFLGQTAKAQDSVAQQNLYNVYLSGKSAAWAPDSEYPDPNNQPNLGNPGDSAADGTFFGILDSAEPEFAFSNGISASDPNQIEVDELNPQEVSYADQSASGHIFCLVDVEASNFNGDGVPAGLTWLENTTGDISQGCGNVLPTGVPPSPVIPTSVPPTSPCDVGSACASGLPPVPPPPSAPPSGGCQDGTYWNAVWSQCLSYWSGTTEYAPSIDDLVLNEINAGEIPAQVPGGEHGVGPGGDVRFSADIDANGESGGTYFFQWSTHKNFSSSHQQPDVAGNLDSSGDLDYHIDLPITTFGDSYTGPIYWRATATTTGGGTSIKGCAASFDVTAGSTISNINNIGDDCTSLGAGGNPNDGNESVASNGGYGPPTGPCASTWSNSNSYNSGDCVTYDSQHYQATMDIPAGPSENAPDTAPTTENVFIYFACSCNLTLLDVGPGTYAGTMTQQGFWAATDSDWYIVHAPPGTVVTGTITGAAHTPNWTTYDTQFAPNGLPCGTSSGPYCDSYPSVQTSTAINFTVDHTGTMWLEIGYNTPEDYTVTLSGSGLTSVGPQWQLAP